MSDGNGEGPPGAEVSGHAYSAAGNRFVLVDGLAGELPERPAELARRLAREGAREHAGLRPDGLLLVARSQAADLRMIVYNADGTRPEACGNGLRCVGYHARLAGHLATGAHSVETDAGTRAIRLREGASGEIEVQALVARPRTLARDLALDLLPGSRASASVDCGNPHLVYFVERPEQVDLESLGRRVQLDARFPRGANVELVRDAEDGLEMRVWERGVGETLSCGTGAAAVCLASRELRPAGGEPQRIRCRGGELFVVLDARGDAWLSGPIDVLPRVSA